MGICVESNTDIRMPHDVWQSLGVHSTLCHVGAERVPTHMRPDLRYLELINTVVPVARVGFGVMADAGVQGHICPDQLQALFEK